MDGYRGDIYGEWFYAGQKDGSAASAEQILPLVFDLVLPSSVVDVGCGTGAWLAVARNLGADSVLGIDGAWVPESMMSIPADHFLQWDLSRSLQQNGRRFDLALCMEVAECLGAEYADSLVADLCSLSDVILFSAAVPGQTGLDHHNEQWPSYWRSRFRQWGYELVDCMRSRLWSDDRVEPWYAQNTYLYVNADRLATDVRLRKAAAETGRMPLEAIHPRVLAMFSEPSTPADPEPIERRPVPRKFRDFTSPRIDPMLPDTFVTTYLEGTSAMLRRGVDRVRQNSRNLRAGRLARSVRANSAHAVEDVSARSNELREAGPLSEARVADLAEVVERPTNAEKLPTLAICTTVLNPDSNYSIWLDYHDRIADLIIIFIHDPMERELIEKLAADRKVIVLDSFGNSKDRSPSGLVSRQVQNNQLAIHLCASKGIDWLLHIDADEILFDDSDGSWRNSASGQLTLQNHEAVPLDRPVENYFVDCTVFKVNGSHPFMAYANGKSVVRIGPDVKCTGPHEFAGFDGGHQRPSNPVVLHYPNPSFDHWVRKFDSLGSFGNFWWDDPDRPIELTFMTKSRDLVRKAAVTGDWDEAREYFNSHIPSPESVERLLESGELRRYVPALPNGHGVPDRAACGEAPSPAVARKFDSPDDTSSARLSESGSEIPRTSPDEGDLQSVSHARRVHAFDRTIYVLLRIKSPELTLFDDVLSVEECDQLIELSEGELVSCIDTELVNGGFAHSANRDSEVEPSEIPLVDRVGRRLSTLMNLSSGCGEGLGIMWYRPEEQLDAPLGHLSPEGIRTKGSSSRGEVADTLVVYLGDARSGAEALFPGMGILVSPIKGQAVLCRSTNNPAELAPIGN